MSEKIIPEIAVVGIDIGKNTFHVIGLDRRGAVVLREKWTRSQVAARFAKMPSCLIGMEACVGAHHLSRQLRALGHDARLMPAKYVRPYSKGQKNDFRDAEAIAEAVQRPTMKFVATKTAEQLDLQALHRVRERLVSQRTGIINQIRAFLLERGADLIDDARALADKALTHAVQSLQIELLGGLGGNELHRRPLDRLGDRLRVAEVVLLALRVRANILCGHQSGVVAKCPELPAQVVRADASFHADQAGRHLGESCRYLAARPFLPQHHRSTAIQANHMECILANINPDDRDLWNDLLGHGVLLRPGCPATDYSPAG